MHFEVLVAWQSELASRKLFLEGTTSHCVCGHPEEAHLFGGRCRVPGCTCDRFWPIPEISAQMWSRLIGTRGSLSRFVGKNPTGQLLPFCSHTTPKQCPDEGLADAGAANPFRLPRLHPGIGFMCRRRGIRVAHPVARSGGGS